MSRKQIEETSTRRTEGAQKFGHYVTKGDDNESRRKRIATLWEYLKTPIDMTKDPLLIINDLEARTQTVGGIISEIAAEKLRAGSTDQNSEMLRWYHKIETSVISDLNLSRAFVNGIMQGTINPQTITPLAGNGAGKKEKDRKLSICQAHVSHVATMIYKEVISRALTVIDRSWLNEDVAAKDVFIFQLPVSNSIRPGAGLDTIPNPNKVQDEY